jgi:hypothetical protein
MLLGQKKLNILFDMKAKICLTPSCKNIAYKHKNYCCTCRVRKWRKSHLLNYFFLTTRGNAKRRGKEWSLTFDEFLEFCNQTNYDKLKGRTALCLSIDRIRSWEGYHKDNIRAISVSDNSKRERGVFLEIDSEWEMEKEPAPF